MKDAERGKGEWDMKGRGCCLFWLKVSAAQQMRRTRWDESEDWKGRTADICGFRNTRAASDGRHFYFASACRKRHLKALYWDCCVILLNNSEGINLTGWVNWILEAFHLRDKNATLDLNWLLNVCYGFCSYVVMVPREPLERERPLPPAVLSSTPPVSLSLIQPAVLLLGQAQQ